MTVLERERLGGVTGAREFGAALAAGVTEREWFPNLLDMEKLNKGSN